MPFRAKIHLATVANTHTWLLFPQCDSVPLMLYDAVSAGLKPILQVHRNDPPGR